MSELMGKVFKLCRDNDIDTIFSPAYKLCGIMSHLIAAKYNTWATKLYMNIHTVLGQTYQ